MPKTLAQTPQVSTPAKPAAEAEFSMFDPRPMATTPVAMGRTAGGGNGMLADWIAQKHKGPYDTKYGQQDLGDDYTVPNGQLTFDAEGQEGGPWHSRSAHWPGGVSGVTVGRGYDFGQHSESAAVRDLTAAGVDPAAAEAFAGSNGLSGSAAKAWLTANKAALAELTPEQQKTLFEATQAEMQKDVQRISDKPDAVAKYGDLDLSTVDPAIRDLLVDLRYRGDYTTNSRKSVQPLAVDGDLEGLSDNLNDAGKWGNVPPDRFARRAAYAKEAVEERDAEQNIGLTFAAPIENVGSPDYDLYGRKE